MAIEDTRPMAFHCALGADVLLVRRLSGVEQLGRPFQFDIELLSEKVDIKLESLLGLNACVRLDSGKGKRRYFNGVMVDLALSGSLGRLHRYSGVMRPWFWLLTRTLNCRVFQNKTVPEIMMQIFGEHGFSSQVENRLHDSYALREYCVQYRESDFNFISRLMEESGIYYYFKHELELHTLVLADDRSSHDPTPEFGEVPFSRIDSDDIDAIGQFFDWEVRRQLQPGTYTLRDYDFEKPSVDLLARVADPNQHAASESEIYDFPGGHRQVGDGERLARLRLQELNAQHEVMRGTTNVRGIGVGALFSLTHHPRAEQNQQYLLSTVRYQVDAGAFESGDKTSVAYSATTTAVPASVPFRSERMTARPRVPGPQTALVVGPKGAEIWTDPEGFGRVKVQFPWDREGANNEASSLWVRVSQAWASGSWGSMHLPHVGDEVVVSFLEGDPDRPIITGRVYNANNMPWQPLPGARTTSYFRDVGENHISMTEGTNIEMFTPEGNTRFDMGTSDGGDGFYLDTDHDYTRNVRGKEDVDIVENSTWNIHGDQYYYIDGFSSTEIKQDEKKKVWGAMYENILGPVDIKLGSLSAKVTAGSSTDLFIGHKHSSFVGIETQISYSDKFGKNHFKRKETTTGPTVVESKSTYIINAVSASDAQAVLDVQGIKLNAGGTKVVISKDGGIVITAKGQVAIMSKASAKILADSGITIKAPTVSATKGIFETKNIKDLG